ncbi:MAG: hypothetical protein NTU98_14625 [Bacteroidetes bacterium]|nr:hypothetical protein [Bacteroidota bacterium]
MKKKKKDRVTILLVAILVTYLLMLTLITHAESLSYAAKLRNEYKKTGNDSIKIERLFDLAFFYYDDLSDDPAADSISQAAIGIAEADQRPGLLLLAYNRYTESNNLNRNYQKALGYALKAEQLSSLSNNPAVVFRSYKNLAAVYLAGYEYDKALEYSYKSLSISASTDNIKWKAESYLDIGRSLEGKNQKIEAFRNYLNAISLAERTKDRDLMTKCDDQLSQFYNLNKLYAKAIKYKQMQIDLLQKAKPVDSVALMWTLYDLQAIDIHSNNNHLNERTINEILDFATRRKNHQMLSYEFALIRNHLIEADKIDQLHDFYLKQFPDQLKRMSLENPGLYNKLNAFFCERRNMPDSALYYFSKAETSLQSNPNLILQSNFYNRFGQFLVRQGKKDQAIAKFSKSYELAKEASYLDYMLNASGELQSVYAGKGDFKNAYNWSVQNKVLSDSMNNMSKKDQMLIMEIDHENRQQELAAEEERSSIQRRNYLEYSAMIIVIIGVFIVLLMLGSLKVPEWIIKMLGFFSFIFLFEFIILIADHTIHEITHGEPWKILLIKIFLLAVMLPMHEWIERRVMGFLLDPRLINISRYPLKSKLKEKVIRIYQK